jgi:hypothetical protein
MKHVFSVLSVTCVAFFTIFLSTTNVSCKKGDTGPKGDTGVANAIYSAWTNVQFSGAVLQSGDTVGVATITAPKITKDVLDKSLIKVYVNLGTAAAPNIAPLPYLDLINGFWINVDFEVGKINLIANGDGSAPYRYIIVEGTVPANGRSAASVDWNNYEEVKRVYNIKD